MISLTSPCARKAAYQIGWGEAVGPRCSPNARPQKGLVQARSWRPISLHPLERTIVTRRLPGTRRVSARRGWAG